MRFFSTHLYVDMHVSSLCLIRSASNFLCQCVYKNYSIMSYLILPYLILNNQMYIISAAKSLFSTHWANCSRENVLKYNSDHSIQNWIFHNSKQQLVKISKNSDFNVTPGFYEKPLNVCTGTVFALKVLYRWASLASLTLLCFSLLLHVRSKYT